MGEILYTRVRASSELIFSQALNSMRLNLLKTRAAKHCDFFPTYDYLFVHLNAVLYRAEKLLRLSDARNGGAKANQFPWLKKENA